MTPPSILLLQGFNFLIGFGSFLAALSAIAAWNRFGWNESAIGLATTIGMLCYATVVYVGGRLSDGWGRARTAACGAGLAAIGSTIAAWAPSASTALIASMAGFAGSALFFPGNVGLFSDAQAKNGRPTLPLHVKIARYNLGWSLGNLCGFIGYAYLDKQPVAVGFMLATGAFLITALWMCRWLRLPPTPPRPEGDRAPHPALGRLTLIGRTALMLACVLTMAQITLLQTALQQQGLDETTAQAWAGRTLMVYSTCYVAMFLIFGWWSGWIMRPWRLAALQGVFVLGSLGYVVLGLTGNLTPITLGLCGGCLGIGFASAYVSSIYYSLRLPHGAARAASLHETFLGIGNTGGPVLAGWVLAGWLAYSGQPAVAGLGAWMLIIAVVLMVWQIAMVPAAVRAGANGQSTTNGNGSDAAEKRTTAP